MPNFLNIFRTIKKSDKSPEFRGIIKIDNPLPVGVYEVALFTGISKLGNPKFSGEIKEKVYFKKPVPSFHETDN